MTIHSRHAFITGLVLALALAWFCQAPANAVQQPVPPVVPGVEPAVYDFCVVFMDYYKNPDKRFMNLGVNLEFETGGEIFRIAAAFEKMSRVFRYKGGPELVFFKQVAGGDGEIEREVLCRADLGAAGQKLVLIMRNRSGKMSTQCLDIDEETFTAGTIRLMNYTPVPVALKIGSEMMTVGSMRTGDIHVVFEGARAIQPLAMAIVNGSDSYLIAKRRVVFGRDNRKLIITCPEEGNAKRMGYLMLSINPYPSKIVNLSDPELHQFDLAQTIE